ncbi:MAG: type IV pilus biogenesis protein PilM [Erysipelotrichaceae bacterium]
MKLLIVFEGRFIRLIVYKGSKGSVSISESKHIDLLAHGLSFEDLSRMDALYPIIKQALQGMKYNKKGVRLILNNRQVISRELRVPRSEDAHELAKLARNEMKANLILTDDYLVEYALMDQEALEPQFQRALGMAVQASTARNYVQLLERLKLKVAGIYTGYESFLALVKQQNYKGITLYFDISQTYVRLYLFEDDRYVLMRNLRYFDMEEENIESIQQIINENLAKMEQFLYTKRRNAVIDHLVFLGNNNHLPTLVTMNQDVASDVSLMTLDCKGVEHAEQFVNALGITVDERIGSEYLRQLDGYKKEGSKVSSNQKFLVQQAIMMIAIVAISTIVVSGVTMFYQFQLNGIQDDIADLNNDATYNQLVLDNNELNRLSTFNQTTQAFFDLKLAQPKVSEEIFTLLYEGEIQPTISSLEVSGETLSITASLPRHADIVTFVQSLIDSNLFASVDYNAFAGSSESYGFQMTFILQGGN